jgi:uncharacterized protein
MRWLRKRAGPSLLVGSIGLSGLIGCQSTEPLGIGDQEFVFGTGQLHVRAPVESLRAIRYHDIVPQQHDYSCGAAALATLLKYHYGKDVAEAQIIVELLQTGDQEQIRHEGFSLLDLKRYAENHGYETKGFRLGQEVLEQLAIPAITLITTRGYNHFVVIKGARDGMVYLADPALGQRQVPKEEFVSEWEGVVFFIAARRDSQEPSPLQTLAGLPPGPTSLVQEIAPSMLTDIRIGPREF